MSILNILVLCFLSLLIKSVHNQQLCDESFKNNLITGVMNYLGTNFLVFRENLVWSTQFNRKSRKFMEPKLEPNFIGSNKASDKNTAISGFVFTEIPKCSLKLSQEKCEKMKNLTVLLYNNGVQFSEQDYGLFKLDSSGEFVNWADSLSDLPYSWKLKGKQSELFEYAKILGTAFNTRNMELYMISWDRVFILHFPDNFYYKPPYDTNQPRSYSGTTGGFELNGKLYFVINNRVYQYNSISNMMFEEGTTWKFFCNKSMITTTTQEPSTVPTIGKTVSTTSETIRKPPEIVSTTEETTTSMTTEETTTSMITEAPEEEQNTEEINYIFSIIVVILAFSVITVCIITPMILFLRRNRTRNKTSEADQRLSKAKQYIKEKKLEAHKINLK